MQWFSEGLLQVLRNSFLIQTMLQNIKELKQNDAQYI